MSFDLNVLEANYQKKKGPSTGFDLETLEANYQRKPVPIGPDETHKSIPITDLPFDQRQRSVIFAEPGFDTTTGVPKHQDPNWRQKVRTVTEGNQEKVIYADGSSAWVGEGIPAWWSQLPRRDQAEDIAQLVNGERDDFDPRIKDIISNEYFGMGEGRGSYEKAVDRVLERIQRGEISDWLMFETDAPEQPSIDLDHTRREAPGRYPTWPEPGPPQEPRAESTAGRVWDIVTDIPKAIKAGKFDTVLMSLRALRTLGVDTTEQIDYLANAEKSGYLEASPESREGVGRAIYEGLRSTVPSISAGVPGAVAGGIAGGGIPGAIVGFAGSGGTLFSLAEYDRFLEEAKSYGLGDDDGAKYYAMLSAAAEGVPEALSDLLVGRFFFGKALAAPAKHFLFQYGVNFLKAAGVEIPSEMLTAALQSKIATEASFPEALVPEPTEAAVGSIGPTGVMTAVTSGFATGMQPSRREPPAPAPEAGPAPPKEGRGRELDELERKYQEKKRRKEAPAPEPAPTEPPPAPEQQAAPVPEEPPAADAPATPGFVRPTEPEPKESAETQPTEPPQPEAVPVAPPRPEPAPPRREPEPASTETPEPEKPYDYGYGAGGFNPAESYEKAVDRVFERLQRTVLMSLRALRTLEPERPTPATPEQPAEPVTTRPERVPASDRLAKWTTQRLRDKNKFTKQEAQAKANALYGGTQAEGAYTTKDLDDSIELGVNRYILEEGINPSTHTPGEYINRLTEILDRLPTQTKRTIEQQQFQQFSTPPHLAYMANWAANITDQDTMLEPSAGTGALAVFAKNAGATVVLNEYNPRRKDLLGVLNIGDVYRENAEHLHAILPDHVKPTVVVMNPPFSSTAGRLKKNKTMYGARHVEQALKRLEPGGRLVAIVGRGMGMDAPTFRDWWADIKKDYTVKANVLVSGESYRKYGTTFDNRLLVIDKVGPHEGTIVEGEVESPSGLYGPLMEVRNARQRPEARTEAPEPKAPQPPSEEASQAGEDSRGPERPSRPRPGVAPPGERRPAGGRKSAGGARVDDAEREPSPRDGDVREGRPGREDQSAVSDTGRRGPDESERPGAPRPGSDRGKDDGDSPRLSKSDRASATLQTESVEDQLPPGKKREFTDSIYEEYVPPKVRAKGAKPHPGKLVESAAMSVVEAPDIDYVPNLPQKTITSGSISLAQYEPIAYAGAAHEKTNPDGTRVGYMVGDGTGVGKARIIAGIILDNLRRGHGGKKAIWVSQKAGLFNDAKKEADAIGLDKKLIKKLPGAGDKIKHTEGVIFTTYNTLGSGQKHEGGQSRLDQIKAWLPADFDGVIAFDESHQMGNLGDSAGTDPRDEKGSGMAKAGLALQRAFPNARVVYASATAATAPEKMSYADRLGLWGDGLTFRNAKDFIENVTEGGVGAMELIAQNLKAMGRYISRGISWDECTKETLEHRLSANQRKMYDTFSEIWQLAQADIAKAMGETSSDSRKVMQAKSQFWGAQQRFFAQVLTSFQMPSVIKKMRKAYDAGEAIVIQLTQTNEAAENRQFAKLDEGLTLDDLDFSPRDTIMRFIERSFPTQQFEERVDEDGRPYSVPVLDSNEDPVENPEAVAMKNELLARIAGLKDFPDNPIDQIIREFGKDTVAEITGRDRRVVDIDGEKIVEDKRTDRVRDKEIEEFMDDKRRILIFSQKGGTGSSYHADNRRKNQRRRNHFLLQAGWQADLAVQGLGRTNRSNQANAPHYVLCTTDVPGHKRFISTIARRLDQLGALTKGQRQAGSNDLFKAKDNLENKHAFDALRSLGADFPTSVDVEAFEKQFDKSLGDIYNGTVPVKQFLNRLLSLNLDTQNEVFTAFEIHLEAATAIAADRGTLDVGMKTLRALKVDAVREVTALEDPVSGGRTEYIELAVTNPTVKLEFAKVKTYIQKGDVHDADFYVNEKSGRIWAVSKKYRQTDTKTGDIHDVVRLVSPRGTAQVHLERSLRDQKKWSKHDTKDARGLWKKELKNIPDTVTSEAHLMTGLLLPVWKRLTGVPEIMRVALDDGRRMIGRLIRSGDIDSILDDLGVTAKPEEKGDDHTPAEIVQNVLERGGAYALSNGWLLKRVRVAQENRIELVGPDNDDATRLKGLGVIDEIINYKLRFFVPTSQAGEHSIGKIISTYSVLKFIKKKGAPASLGDSLQSEGGTEMYSFGTPPKWLRDALKKGFLQAAQRTRIYHYILHLLGKHPLSPGAKKEIGPPVLKFITNLEKILSQIKPGRVIYELARTFREDTLRKFNDWQRAYKEAVKGLTNEEKRVVLSILDTTEEITGDDPVEIAAAKVRELLQDIHQFMSDRDYPVNYREAYLPHIFQGTFWIKIKGKDSIKAETVGEALKRAQELLEAGEDVKIVQDTFVPYDEATLLTRRGYWKLISTIQDALNGEAPVLDRDDIHQAMKQSKAARPKPSKRFFGNTMMRVVNNQNFLKDLDKVMELYFYGASRKVHQNEFLKKTQTQLESFPGEARELRNFVVGTFLPGVLGHPSEWEKAVARSATIQKFFPGASPMSVKRALKDISLPQYAMDLGLSTVSAFANSTQFAMNAYPIVGEASALKGYRRGMKALKVVVSPGLAKKQDVELLQELVDMGITGGISSITGQTIIDEGALKTFIKKLSFTEGEGALERARGHLEGVLMPFSTVELANRAAAYFAGKNYAAREVPSRLRKGKPLVDLAKKVAPETSSLVELAKLIEARHNDQEVTKNASWRAKQRRLIDLFSKKFGYELNDKTNFRHTRENLPILLQNAFFRFASPYKSFVLDQVRYSINTYANLGKNPLRALRFSAVGFALAGVAGNPVMWMFFLAMNRLIKEIWGFDTEKWLRKHDIKYGLFGRFGADISGSLAVFLPRRAMDLLGRFGQLGVNLGIFVHSKWEGKGTVFTERKLKKGAWPSQAWRVLEGNDIIRREVYTTPYSRTPVAIDEDPTWAGFKRMLGILPKGVSKAFDEENILRKKKEKYKSISSDMTERWVEAIITKDPKRRARRMDRELRRYVRHATAAYDNLVAAKTESAALEALTDVLFWYQWAEDQKKFENALVRKALPRQIQKKLNLPTYMRGEAFAQ